MTRSESLAALHEWATLGRVTYRPYFTSPAAEAYDHGLRAVRAIRAIRAWHSPLWTVREAKEEARLAFRAALDAVGLKTL